MLPHYYNPTGTIISRVQDVGTLDGENGTGLSGGKKQRLTTVRASLRQPSTLVFDEAVSNLDRTTSEQFAQTINKFKGKVTILFITHKLPIGLHVDEAVVLDKADAIQTKNKNTSEVEKEGGC